MGAAEKLNYGNEPNNKPQSGLYLVESKDAMDVIREQIIKVANKSYEKGYIPEEFLETYETMRDRQKKGEISEEQMRGMLEFAEKFDRDNDDNYDEFKGYIKEGIEKGYMSRVDEEYWLKNYINNRNLVEKYDEIKTKLLEKKANRIKNRKKFDELTNHPLVKEGKIDLGTMNRMLTPREFLQAKVPERIKFLNTLHEAIQKGEEKEKKEEKIRAANNSRYEGILKTEWGKGVIGKKTYKEFMNEFQDLDTGSQLHWIKAANGEMSPRKALKEQIDELPDEERAELERMREDVGYKKLKLAYIGMKPKLKKRCMKRIKEEKEKGLFGQHTVDSFEVWYEPLNTYKISKAFKGIDYWMNEYQKLKDRAEQTLTQPEQDYLNAQIRDEKSTWGYKEYKKFLEDSQFRKEACATNVIDLDRFQNAQSTAKKKGMKETAETILNRGEGRVLKFIRNIKAGISGRTHKESYVDSLQEGIAKHRAIKEEREKLDSSKTTIQKDQKEDSSNNNLLFLQSRLRKKREEEMDRGKISEQKEEAPVINLTINDERSKADLDQASNQESKADQLTDIQKEDDIQVDQNDAFKRVIFADEVQKGDAIEVTFGNVGFEEVMINETFKETDILDIKTYYEGETFDLSLEDMRNMIDVLEEEVRDSA